MLDSVLVINVLVDLAKRFNNSLLIVNVYFEKAYHCVCWEHLTYLMRRMRFGSKWLAWMKALIFNSSMSILVNGSLTKDFTTSRDLGKGDQLSLFLFLMVAEGLACLMHNVVALGEFQGFHLNKEIHFELLQFTDDTVLIDDGS